MSILGRVAAIAIMTVLVSGCSSTTPAPTTSTTSLAETGKRFSDNFDAATPGTTPNTWVPSDGVWGAGANLTSIGHAKLMEGAGNAALNSLVAIGGGAYRDFEAEADFNMLSGDHPQGAGLILHFQDASNYQIIRYSISEQGWHLFTVHAGNRDKRSDATVFANTTSPTFHAWVHLRVVSQAGHVTAFDGTVKVIDYKLPNEVAKVGYAGLFVRGNTKAQFDNFTSEPL